MGYTESIKLHGNYPNVLGETTFSGVGEASCPPLTLAAVDAHTVTIQPLAVEMFDITLVALGVFSGRSQTVDVTNTGGANGWGRREPVETKMIHTFRWQPPAIEAGVYSIQVDVDGPTAAAILALEREHKLDAEYAYARTVQHLADGVARLAGQQFTGDDERAARRAALEALAEAVGERFVPAYPMVPANWSLLARKHCAALIDESKKRDTGGQHHVTWTVRAAGSGALHLVPQVPALGPGPAEVLLLSGLPVATPDWDADAAPTCPFTPGQDVEVIRELVIDGETVPVGWRGEFHDEWEHRFRFRLQDPHDDGTARHFVVPPAQFSGLAPRRIDTAAAAPYHNPFAINDIVQVVRSITSDGVEIPVGAIGQYYEFNVIDGGARLSFDFPTVRGRNGGALHGAVLIPADLASLEKSAATALPEPVTSTVADRPGADGDDVGIAGESGPSLPDDPFGEGVGGVGESGESLPDDPFGEGVGESGSSLPAAPSDWSLPPAPSDWSLPADPVATIGSVAREHVVLEGLSVESLTALIAGGMRAARDDLGADPDPAGTPT